MNDDLPRVESRQVRRARLRAEGKWAALPIVVGLALSAAVVPSASAADRYLRASQRGYGTSDGKTARVLSRTNLSGQTVQALRVPANTVAWQGTLPSSGGAWGSFGFTHRVDLSGLTENGLFRLRLLSTGETSSNFSVGDPLAVAPGYENLGALTRSFFAVQRCGPTDPLDHDVCHLLDAHHIVGGPNQGQSVNVRGGWHDAGDYIKFGSTVAYSVHFLLWADQLHPNLAGDTDGNGRSDLLDEAQLGARFLLRLRYQPGRFLFQVSDEADHGEGWRLPEDDGLSANRPAYYGVGKNHLGRYAAALARASRAFHVVAPSFADSCLTAAIDAYQSLPSAPNLSSDGNFYVDDTWHDKVALGAIELYLATGQASYLAAAKSEADAAGEGWWAGWATVNGMADLLLLPFHPPSRTRVENELDAWLADANAHPFGMAATEVWGVTLVITQMAAEALLYERATGNAAYRNLAYLQREFLFGVNPWGVCFVSGAGPVSSIDLHHQVATIVHGGSLPGALAEGPVTLSAFQQSGIVLDHADEYAEFQASRGVYHDDRANYMTNEPTLAGNASLILLLAALASRPLATSDAGDPDLRGAEQLAIWPNPSRGGIVLTLTADHAPAAPWSQSTRFANVLDASGRRITRLSLLSDVSGRWIGSWDGIDATGHRSAAGAYWIHVPGGPARTLVRLP